VVGGVAVADSAQTLLLLEKNHRPVYYFPVEDVRMELLSATDRHTHCPLKGKASYWTIEAGEKRVENAAWAYLKPIPGAAPIRGMVAFYAKKLDELIID